jgi:hypothetical protein
MPDDAPALEIVEYVLDGADLFQFVIGDLNVEGLLHLHDQFDEVERVGPEIVGERGFGNALLARDVQLLRYNADDLFFQCHENFLLDEYDPCSGRGYGRFSNGFRKESPPPYDPFLISSVRQLAACTVFMRLAAAGKPSARLSSDRWLSEAPQITGGRTPAETIRFVKKLLRSQERSVRILIHAGFCEPVQDMRTRRWPSAFPRQAVQEAFSIGTISLPL